MTRDDRRRWRLPFAIVLLIAACSHNHPAGTSMGARALASLTPIEKSVLKDKKVTVAEVMRSTRTYIECLDAHGLSHGVEDPSDLTTSGVSVEFGAPPGTADPDARCENGPLSRSCLPRSGPRLSCLRVNGQVTFSWPRTLRL